jgi:3-oxoacyl-[acyl-carrier protein] reductase
MKANMRSNGNGFKGWKMAGNLGRIALVTGAGSAEGIGFAIARALAKAGTRVALTSTTERIFERAQALGNGHAAFVADLTVTKSVNDLIKAIMAKFARIDIVVNNAGMVQQGTDFKSSRIEETTDDDWQRHLSLNATTAFNVTRAVLPIMQKQQYGRIVNVASVTGPLVTNPKAAGYSSAKAAMTGLTRVTAIENASRNITCNAVLPGWIETASSSPEEILAGKATPSKRPGRPDEVAAACLFLASEEASYINGAMLVVDGANSIVEFKGAGDAWY